MSNKQILWILAGLVVLGIIFVVIKAVVPPGSFGSLNNTGGTEPGSADESAVVENVVTQFGSQLQMVSLLAPTSSVDAAMEQYYSSYVSPDLLSQWEAQPSEAPGREVSSPWPQDIQITSIAQTGPETYTVEGNVEEAANDASGTTSVVATYPVELTVENYNGSGTWLITGYAASAQQGVE